jgi:riboflavin synthase
MFTGIVKSMGRVAAVREGAARRLAIDTGGLATAGWKAGDSIAVSGVCLTLVAVADGRFEPRSRARRWGGRRSDAWRPATASTSSRPSARRGHRGHLVTGHVDGVASVRDCSEEGGALRATVEAPAALARFIAEKGSIALDGVSLTVNRIDGREFDVDLVPHTTGLTTLGELAAGRLLNLEVDLVARYSTACSSRGGSVNSIDELLASFVPGGWSS